MHTSLTSLTTIEKNIVTSINKRNLFLAHYSHYLFKPAPKEAKNVARIFRRTNTGEQ